jgi:hypothetical protein
MIRRNMMLIGAAFAGTMLTASAGAVDQNHSRTFDSGDRGVVTPQSVEETTTYEHRSSGGVPAIPRSTNPMNPNEARPFVQQPEGVRPQMRSDNPNLPSPRTPSAANESAPQPLQDPTNTTGMEGSGPVGGTR